MECTTDKAFELRNLVLQELVKIIVVCYIRNLCLKFKCFTLYHRYLNHIKYNIIDVVVMGGIYLNLKFLI